MTLPPGPVMLKVEVPPETPEFCGIQLEALMELDNNRSAMGHPYYSDVNVFVKLTGQMLVDGKRGTEGPSQSVGGTWGMVQYWGSENHWSANWLLLRFCTSGRGRGD